ncbi:heptosyltransferase-2 [Pelosinus fermentans]|uniref:glycosyltransferase family 9 protein n=1 Tax=Pelosinus fermentans TaxID=365349 RepID=UPI0002685C18|nr:glycosyltransferase family 9 protein [Pelosinus fermentans]OAM92765.1 glycosyl transferase family 9 [Pelosinus fermentans DSM 17108]SDQ56192.1 heptosyltransferase-2 [Pelosinus fermentans]
MRKILVINRLGIGDVVLSTPLAQVIKETVSTQVGFMVAQKAVDVVTNHPYIDEVFSYHRSSKKMILQQIKDKSYTEALILDERLTSTLLAWQAGCKAINKGFEISIGAKRLFSGKQLNERADLHYTSYIRYLDKHADVPEYLPTMGCIDTAGEEKINTWIYKNNVAAKKLVLVTARGLSDNKNWPPEHFTALNDYLNKQGIVPVYLGAKQDADYIESISGTKINAAGDFSLREVVVLAKYASLCITLCTGTMHIITAANIPIIALYGPTSPLRWAPKHADVLQADLPCVPCERLDCTNTVYKQCMQIITPQQVIAKIEAEGWLK